MRKLFTIAACAIGALALPTAWAVTNFTGNTAPAGAHYARNSSDPACSDNGSGVSCTGTVINGVGNTDAALALSVSYSATVQCKNKGGNIVDVKTQVKTSSSPPDEATDVKNGSLTVSPITSSSPTPQTFLDAATCPNPNWTKQLLGSPILSGFTYTLTFEGYTEPAITITWP